MEISIRLFFVVIFTFWFTFLMVDFNHNISMKHDSYESVRASNQDSLLDLQKHYDEYEELNTAVMLEEWLVNFVDNNNLSWDEIEIGFVQIETDPPLYLVNIEGYLDSYAIVNKDAFVSFYSGTTILSKDKIKEFSGS